MLVICTLIGTMQVSANAAIITGSFAGISSYTMCSYGNRAGKQYVQNFSSMLSTTEDLFDGDNWTFTENELLTNNEVTEAAIAALPRSTLFVYAGHGVVADTLNNGLHLNNTTIGVRNHSALGETSDEVNYLTTETSFLHKYVVLYSCNQLKNGNSTTKANNILDMMDGTRLMMGFASTMYLDSREASLFAYEMNYRSIIDAYTYAAECYQVQRSDGDVIARVVGYTPAEDDMLSVNENYAPAATSTSSYFDILVTTTIPHTGETVE
jgi:uncharacterized protein involved in type VI secretion and phage assembly